MRVSAGDTITRIAELPTSIKIAFYACVLCGAIAAQHNPSGSCGGLPSAGRHGGRVAIVWEKCRGLPAYNLRHGVDGRHFSRHARLAARRCWALPVARARQTRCSSYAGCGAYRDGVRIETTASSAPIDSFSSFLHWMTSLSSCTPRARTASAPLTHPQHQRQRPTSACLGHRTRVPKRSSPYCPTSTLSG